MVDDHLSRLCFQISGALYRANILWLQKLLFVPAWMSRVGRCVLEPLFSCEFDRHDIILNVNPDHADRPRPILTINQTSVIPVGTFIIGQLNMLPAGFVF